MPVVQSTYSNTMQPGLEGQIVSMLDDDDVETRKCETAAGILFGRAVSEGANANGAILGGATKFIGITVRSVTEIPIAPNTTYDAYAQYTNMGVLTEGQIWVRPVAAVTHGSPATYDSTTGQLNPAAAGVAIPNSRYRTSASAGASSADAIVSLSERPVTSERPTPARTAERTRSRSRAARNAQMRAPME